MAYLVALLIAGLALMNRITGKPAPRLAHYPPNSPAAVALFEEAAKLIGAPLAWASEPGLHYILGKESGGWVGRPNYTYDPKTRASLQARLTGWPAIHSELQAGKITAKSSATGLGQLLLRNVDKYYPAGRDGIGDALQEAAGMLAYIRDRYETPKNAGERYGKMDFEGY